MNHHHRLIQCGLALLIAVAPAWAQFGGSKILEKAKRHAQEQVQEASDRDPAEEARKADQKQQREEAQRAERERRAAEARKAEQQKAKQAAAKDAEKPSEPAADPDEKDKALSLQMKREDFPRIAGSPPLAHLGMHIAARVIGTTLSATSGGGYAFTDQQDRDHFSTRLAFRGAHPAYEMLIGRMTDIALVLRKPTAEELELAEKLSVELDIRTLAGDALVFAVHPDNPVRSLSRAQLQGVLNQRETQWKALGGTDATIRVIASSTGPDLQAALKELVAHDAARSPRGLADRAAAALQPGALVYGTYTALKQSQSRLLAIDGVTPAPATIADRSYPLVLPACIVTRQDAPPAAATLREWLLTSEGQRVLAELGFVPLK